MDLTYALSHMRFPVNSQLATEIKDSHISHFTRKYGRSGEQVKCVGSDESESTTFLIPEYIHNSHRYQKQQEHMESVTSSADDFCKSAS